MFTDREQRALVDIARAAVTRCVTGDPIEIPAAAPFPEASGAFVTLKRNGQLRGCIGTLEANATRPSAVAEPVMVKARYPLATICICMTSVLAWLPYQYAR